MGNQNSKIQKYFKQPAVQKYNAGDRKSYELLVGFLWDKGSSKNLDLELYKLIEPMRHLLVAPEKATFNLDALERFGASEVARIAFCQILKDFSFAKKDFVLTNTFIQSLVGSLDNFFVPASKHGKERAFEYYRKIIYDGFKARRMLERYAIRLAKTDQLQLPRLAKDLSGVANPIVFRDYLFPHSVLSINHFCGTRSCKRDKEELQILRNSLKRSHSMEDFITDLISVHAQYKIAA